VLGVVHRAIVEAHDAATANGHRDGDNRPDNDREDDLGATIHGQITTIQSTRRSKERSYHQTGVILHYRLSRLELPKKNFPLAPDAKGRVG
jgi:hypothetical protein